MGKFYWLLSLVIFFLVSSCVSRNEYETVSGDDDNPLPVPIDTIIHGSFESGTNAPFGNPYPNGSDVVQDATAPDGRYVIRFKYPKGLYGGSAPNSVGKVFPSPLNEFWAQYYFKYSANWRWNTITNKHIYISTGARGNNDMNFTVMEMYYGAPMAVATQQPPDGKLNQMLTTTGWTLQKDKWYKVVFRAKMNTSGVKNGILQLWVDNVLRIDRSDVLYRQTGVETGFVSFAMTPVYGGGAEEIPAEQYLYFDHVIVQTTPF